MNAGSDPVSHVSSGLHERPTVRRRGPPKAIQLLLPVWGTRYIKQFLDLSLPTLLAPGNLPALAQALPCKLVILTSSDGANLLKNFRGIQYLQGICAVEISIIDDLITGDNYSTTITLAYARAVQATGDAMLDTCFFFLISDYIMADGSLRSVLARITEGYSGVFAGNFQVIEEDARDSFFARFDEGEPAIAVPPRELIGWAFRYLHPMTIANTVNFPLCHSAHSNRLFWRVDETTLIGRFYLMHMICVRPEVTNFVIGASCDYSFVPEMCPSDNVHVMTDSDEYLVLEMQGRGHESYFVRLGAVEPDALAESLAEWTTARHRANAHSVVVFHVGNRSRALGERIAESKTYIEAIEKRLPKPQPHRNHPYWVGAITAHLAAKKFIQEASEVALKGILTETSSYQALLYRGRELVFGRVPNVRRTHPRWIDYETIIDLARRYFDIGQRRILIVSGNPEIFLRWFSDFASSVTSIDFHRLFAPDQNDNTNLRGPFDGCLLVLRREELADARESIAGIRSVLSAGAPIIVFTLNAHGLTVGRQFGSDVVNHLDRFFDFSLVLEKVVCVRTNFLSRLAFRNMRTAFVLTLKNRLYFPIALLTGGGFILVSLMTNLLRLKSLSEPKEGGLYSSIIMVLRPTGAGTYQAGDAEKHYIEWAAQRFRRRSPQLTRVGHGV